MNTLAREVTGVAVEATVCNREITSELCPSLIYTLHAADSRSNFVLFYLHFEGKRWTLSAYLEVSWTVQ